MELQTDRGFGDLGTDCTGMFPLCIYLWVLLSKHIISLKSINQLTQEVFSKSEFIVPNNFWNPYQVKSTDTFKIDFCCCPVELLDTTSLLEAYEL